MPEKSHSERAKRAKRKGTTLSLKPTDVHGAEGQSTHKAKKGGRQALGTEVFEDRHVSPRRPPGQGLTARGGRLPLAETGSSASRRKTLPVEAAAGYRKEGRAKSTTGRGGDTTPLKAGKAYRRKGLH